MVEPVTSPWESTVVLGDGDTAVIRPLTPDDRDALAEFHQAQSRESVYRRFFSPKPVLTTSDLDHFTNVDMVDRAALAVESHGQLIAWSSYERWPGRDEAEAAFMVADSHQGKGVATLMLEHLAAIAVSNGITRFTAEVLGDNRAMLAVFAKAGWPLERRFDSGVVDLDWEIGSTEEFRDSVERREQRADSRAVARLLLPRAIAVIGASTKRGSVGEALWRHVSSSSSVSVYAVNPAHADLDGVPCVGSVAELPDEVSLAVIAVPADELEATIDSCIDKRMRGALVITTTDGTDIEMDTIVDRARRNGLRIIGPSSMGIASPRPESGLQAALVDVALPAGNVAISMQSGSLGGSLLRQARDLELGLSWFISLGDKADISANDLLQFWEEDVNTKVVAMYTESFGNPSKFARIARRVSATMPIVAVRTGAASAGLMGGALFQGAGLIEVPTVTDLLDTARVLATQPVMKGRRVALLTNSRSPGILATAALETAGLEVSPAPIQLDWRSSTADFRLAIEAAIRADGIDGILVIYAPAVAEAVALVADDIDGAANGSDKPVIAVLLGSGNGPVRPGSRVPAFAFPEQAAAALGRSAAYGHWLADEADASPSTVRLVDPAEAQRIIDTIVEQRREYADLGEQRLLLASYGIEFAEARSATSTDAAAVAAMIGFPVAIKSVRRRPGRSVHAGVALDVASTDEAAEVVTAMRESLGADADELIVQSMTAPGVEVRVHCEHDDRLGVIVSVGIGGAQADAIGDRTSRLAPVSPAVATSMLNQGRLGDALGTEIDTSAVVDVIVQAAQLTATHRRIVELDLNPVMASKVGATVTDAVIRVTSDDEPDEPIRKLA